MLVDQGLEIGDTLSDGCLTVLLVSERTRYSLRIKAEDLTAFNLESGLGLPERIGQSSLTEARMQLCLGPDEWLIVTQPDLDKGLGAQLKRLSDSFIFSFTDISHRNIALTVQGSEAVAAINIGCPLDLSPEHFPVGKVTRTVFENAPIMLLRTGEDVFHLECWRSYGPYVTGLFARYAKDIEMS